MSDSKTRVHTLAKEMGVSSKAIIEKCAAEGIVIKNHMHVLSAGLEATIREWFASASVTTAVEESVPVDLSKARVRRHARKADGGHHDGESGEATAVAEEPGTSDEPHVADEPATDAALRPAAIAAPSAPAAPPEAARPVVAPTAAPPAPPPLPPRLAPGAPTKLQPAALAKPPQPPQRIAPMGPQNVPAPAKLTGPKVVRMDTPEFVAAPRPASRPSYGSQPPPGPPPPAGARPSRGGRSGPMSDEEVEEARKRQGAATARHRANPRRSSNETASLAGELLREWRDRDLIERRERLDHVSGRGIDGMKADESQIQARGQTVRARPSKREAVDLTEPIVLKEFCAATGIAFNGVFRKLQEVGIIAGLNHGIDAETANLLAAEFGVEINIIKARSALDRVRERFAAMPREKQKPRPPVVTVLGHVDHGKTSLLDRIRKANVAAGEAGGITQHIGAYRVRIGDRYVTFLDTPGHEAFTAMRARGAQMTDVVVLVVAADDGVMPQTIEAINHARAAKVPIVVALNKIDLPQADITKVFGQLAEQQLVPQDWGGETDVIKTSATTGEGVEDLLNHLATLTDLLELKADPTMSATGTVIEAFRDEKRGQIARILVQEGTLGAGDIVVCGAAFGRIRALVDEAGRKVREAGPSTPVEVMGLDSLPQAGDRFYEVDDLNTAKDVAEQVTAERRAASLVQVAKPTTLETLLASRAGGEVPELNVIVKADVQGSVDVLKKTLSDIPTNQVKLNVLHAAVGSVSESDVTLAQASQAIIIGFHVVPDPGVQRAADDKGVDIRLHTIIYNVTDEIRKALEGLLEPTDKIESRGRAEVREVFNITRVGKVAGCMVRDGVIMRNNKVRLLRDGVLIKDGASLASLKRFKNDAKEVRAGLECGIRIDGFDDVKPGDVIEAYEVVKVARKL